MSIDVSLKLARLQIVEGKEEVIPFALRIRGIRSSGLPAAYFIAIDTSFSMDGAKIYRAKEATLRMLEYLKPCDLVTVYGFNANVRKVVEMVPASERDRIADAVLDLKLGGGTNIYGVLRSMYEDAVRLLMKSRSKVSDIRIVLLTDGVPTVGPKDPEAIISIARKLGELVSASLVVGVGESYNEHLLVEIAKSTNGEFEHVSRVDALLKLFEKFVVSYKDLSAKNVRVYFRMVPGVDVVVYGKESYLSKEGLEIHVGDVHFGEIVTITGEIVIPPQKPGTRAIGSVVVRYVDAVDGVGKETSIESITLVCLPRESVRSISIDEKVLIEVSTVKLAEILKRELLKGLPPEEAKKKIAELMHSTMLLDRSELYHRTIDLKERLEREGLSPELVKELLAILSKILSGRIVSSGG